MNTEDAHARARKVADFWLLTKEPARNKLVSWFSWFSNFVSWQEATNAHSLSSVIEERRRQGAKGQTKWVSYFLPKEPARNKLVSWFSNFVSWQGATNAHSLSSVIEERRRQGAKGQTKWVSYFLPAP